MRNLLALLAAFTLSTSTAITAVACGTSEQTTTVIFDWNGVINGKNNETATDFFERLLRNQNAGIGQALYKDIVDYVSLSILKTNPTFTTQYQFAQQSVENQIKNIQDSLRARYGRSWETQWRNFLKDPAQGGDGQTGSYQRYFDILLKNQANTIVSQYYVGDNYHNYQYYSSTEIGIWLSDMYSTIRAGKWQNIFDYQTNGTYGDKVWIVANSVNKNGTPDPITALGQTIETTDRITDISLSYIVAKTKDDKPLKPGNNYLIDPSNTIKGLLSDQQVKIAQVWMKNQGPIWTRQIVIPFDENRKNNALNVAIDADSFRDSRLKLQNIINTINTPGEGFEEALKIEMGNIAGVTSSAQTGDLGLVTLNSEVSNIKASFSYYLYRYITSNQGIGQNATSIAPYNLAQYTGTNPSDLFPLINRTAATSNNQTSRFNDIVWMVDGDNTSKYSGTDSSGNPTNMVAVFIDTDGIHFVQTPGISYSSTVTTESTQDIITGYTQLLANEQEVTWADAQKLADRPGGLTNIPYLDFLQTQYLLWNANKRETFFNLNESLSTFTSGSTDITSDSWWDYILYFNNNINNIHWNLSEVLGTNNINASSNQINKFVTAMQSWFLETNDRRLNRLQGTSNTETLIKNVSDWNDNLDKGSTADTPVARLDPSDINYYLINVAAATIWWYDPNSIS